MSVSISHLRAILFALLGYTLWVFADTGFKLAGESRLPPYEIVCLTGLAGTLFMLIRALLRREIKALRPKQPRKQLLRAVIEFGNFFFIVVALKHMTLTMFYIVVFTAPMAVALLAAVFLHERLGLARALAVIAGFAGVVIAVDPFGPSAQGDWVGYASCAVCVTCFSINIVWLRRMMQTETSDSVVFVSNLVQAALAGFFILGHVEWPAWPLLLILTAIGVLGSLGDICSVYALKNTTAANVSQYHYTQLITGAVIGYLVWHEVPTPSMYAGSAIIVLAGLYIAARSRKMENIAAIGSR